MSKLRLKTAGVGPAEIELVPGTNSMGRISGNTIQLNDPSVSSRHGEILWEAEAVLFRDFNSTNGSFLDGQPVKECILRPGAILKLGSVELVFEATPAVVKPEPIRLASSRMVPVPMETRPEGSTPAQPRAGACTNHPDAAATLICRQCHLHFCDACITPRQTATKTWLDCPVCRGKCVPLAEQIEAQRKAAAKDAESFFQVLPGAFAYPVGKGGAWLLILGTLLYLILDVASRFSMTVTIFAGGYLFAYMQKILASSAHGDEQLPDWPEYSAWWDDILIPFLLLIFTIGVCFGPGAGYLYSTGGEEGDLNWMILVPLLAFGFIYFPMGLLAVGISDNAMSLNPLIVVPAMAKIPLEYLVVCLAFFGTVALRYGSEWLLKSLIPIPVLPTLITGFLALYFLAVQMRILGLMYHKNRQKLGWHSERHGC